jgi:tripartite-type tricarboxylate transporter receptor subunit TctC
MTIAAGRRAAIAAALVTLAAPRLAHAAWPERALRIVVAFPPGSSTDVVARALAQKLGEGIGQAVVVENRGGAGGNLGAQAVKAATDGHTLLMHSTAISLNPTLYRNAG